MQSNLVSFLDHLPALPEAVVLLGACVLMIADLYVRDARRGVSVWIAQIVLLAAAAATLFVVWVSGGASTGAPRYFIFHGLYVADSLSHFLKLVAYATISIVIVYSRQYLMDRGLLRGEFLSLLLFALLGMMVMMSANSFLTVYLGLELLSLCLYALVALHRDSAVSTPARSSSARWRGTCPP